MLFSETSDIRIDTSPIDRVYYGADLAFNGNVAWTLAVIPDVQVYTEIPEYNIYYYNMMDWIVANKDTYNIQHVAFLGDITNGDIAGSNVAAQWEVTQTAIFKLNGILPYTLCVGNHDEYHSMLQTGIPSFFPSYFQISDNSLNVANGMTEYVAGEYYRGSYQKWTDPNGRKWLFLALDYWPDRWITGQVAWAQGVIEANLDHSVLIITHSGLQETVDAAGETDAIRLSTTQIALFDNYTNKYPNIQIMMCGHSGDNTDVNEAQGPMAAFRRSVIGQEYNRFHEILFNAQQLLYGGEGFLRLYQFMDDDLTVRGKTYSVENTKWYTSDRHHFSIELDQTEPQVTLDAEIDLKGFLEFNETTGSIAYDSTPGEHDWRVNDAPVDDSQWIASGHTGRGIRIGNAGTGPWLEVNNNPDYTGTTYTVALHFKIAAWPSISILITRKMGPSPDYYTEFQIKLNIDGTLTYKTKGTGGTRSITGTTAIATAAWQHVAMTCDGSTFQGYLNGIADGIPGDVTSNLILELSDTSDGVNELQIFGSTSGPVVDVDNVRYYSRQLSAVEIATISV